MPEPYSQRASKLANQHEGEAFVLFSQIIEFFFRQHIEFRIDGGNRRVAARTMIEKRQPTKELTRTKGRNVTQTRTSSDAAHDSQLTTTDEIKIRIRIAALKNHLARLA